MNRVKTFNATGIAPDGRLYSGDLNAIQDAAAGLTDLAQNLSVGSITIGETGLQFLKFGVGEVRLVGALRTDGIIRGLGGLYAGAFTSTARDALVLPPAGLIILNTTTNRLEANLGTAAVPVWRRAGGLVTNADIDAAAAIVASKIAGYPADVTKVLLGDGTWAAPASVPAGAILDFAGTAAPSGYLLCDGAAVLRSTYATLFTAISTNYGVGDGTTTFNLPDMRGRMAVGKGTHVDVDALNDSDGLAVLARRPKHKTSITDPGHTHGGLATNGGSAAFGADTPLTNNTNGVSGTATTGITAGPQTGSEPIDAPAYLVVNKIIKA